MSAISGEMDVWSGDVGWSARNAIDVRLGGLNALDSRFLLRFDGTKNRFHSSWADGWSGELADAIFRRDFHPNDGMSCRNLAWGRNLTRQASKRGWGWRYRGLRENSIQRTERNGQ